MALPPSWDVVVMTGAQAAITALEEEATCQGWGSLELSCQELSFQSRLPTPGHFKEEEMNFCFVLATIKKTYPFRFQSNHRA